METSFSKNSKVPNIKFYNLFFYRRNKKYASYWPKNKIAEVRLMSKMFLNVIQMKIS